jgi:hypothetical protein
VNEQYVLVDTLNDQVFGPYESDWEAAHGGIDILLRFGEVARGEAAELRDKLSEVGTDGFAEELNDRGIKSLPLRRPLDWTNLR